MSDKPLSEEDLAAIQARADAPFRDWIVHAPTDLHRLLAEVARLRVRVGELEAISKGVEECFVPLREDEGEVGLALVPLVYKRVMEVEVENAYLLAQLDAAHEQNWTPTCMDYINVHARELGMAEVERPSELRDKIDEVIWMRVNRARLTALAEGSGK